MSDVTFKITSNANDGYTNQAGGGIIYNDSLYIIRCVIGNYSSASWRAIFRFTNITIPPTAIIVSAFIRLTSGTTSGINTCNCIVHFEDDANPIFPTDGDDCVGRSLTVGVDWDDIEDWSPGEVDDSPDLAAILQDVIDLPGWNSGQSVTVHILDNGSTANAKREPARYTNKNYDEAQLIVSYSIPYGADVNESIEISESIEIGMDLVIQESIALSEAVTMRRSLIDLPTVTDSIDISEYEDLLLGFDESLPLISENITISESLTIIRGLGGVPVQSEDIEITESVGLLVGFGETLPEFSESITITEYQFVDVGPQITVFESITVNDYGNIQPKFSVSENLSLSESVTVMRGYQVGVDESALFSDTFVVFNYSKWLRENVGKLGQRFYFTLTGDADGQEDIEIPASAIYARKVSGNQTYLQVTIPSFNYSSEISLRSSGQMKVEMAYIIDGQIVLREVILEADLENIDIYDGPVNRSVVLSGHKTVTYGGNLITFQRSYATYKSIQNSVLTYRLSFIDPFANPGDTIVIGDDSMIAGSIVYIINEFQTTMEIREG